MKHSNLSNWMVIGLMGALLLIGLSGCGGGDTYKVTLTVKLADDSRFYVIEEIPPSGVEIVNTGLLTADNQGHLKYVEFQDAKDNTFEYTIMMKEDATFSGSFSIDGVTEDIADIKGQTSPSDTTAVSMDGPGIYRTFEKAK